MQELNLGVVDASYNYGFIYSNIDDDTEVYNLRGITYSERNEQNQAIASFNKAIELKSDVAEAYNNRGIAYATLCSAYAYLDHNFAKLR